MQSMRAKAALGVAVGMVLVSVPLLASARTSSASSTPAAAVPASDWTTYHHDRMRTGVGSIQGAFSSLHARFTWRPPASSGQLFASPLVVGHVAYVTTLGNRVFAVSTLTGKTRWSRSLGAPFAPPQQVCGDIRPTLGIVSTPVIDEGRGELFVSGMLGRGAGARTPAHRLFGISLRDGRVKWSRAIDPPGQDPTYLLQRVSLAIAKGRVVVGFGGNAGDCGTYHGWLESVAENGRGGIDRFEVASGPGQGRGAVWMGGAAPTVDATGHVYVATGNGDAVSAGATYDHSDAVLKLTSTMQLVDWFAPTSWYSDNAADLDLGSGAPQLLANGLVVQVGKTQTAYVLSSSGLGHLGGSAATFPVCEGMGPAFGGDAIAGSLVVIPCAGGLNAVRITASPPGGAVVWTTGAAGSPPVVAAGFVWSVSGSTGSSTLYALDPATGAVRLHVGLGGEVNHFPTPAVGDGLVLVTTTASLVAFSPG